MGGLVNYLTGKGMLIAVEGIDGAGKTTQSLMLVEGLRNMGFNAEYTAEPTYGRVGDILRLHVSRMKVRMPIYEALLFSADRFEHVVRVVKPKIKRGVIVVSDRYLYSTLAYQGAAGLDLKWLRSLSFFAPKPDVTIYLDLPSKISLERKKGKRSVYENVKYVEKVRKIYLNLAKTENFAVFNGDEPAEEVHSKIMGFISKLIRKSMSSYCLQSKRSQA